MLIDTHAHLMVPEFDEDREAVIQRARDAGVGRIVTIGFDLPTSRAAIALASRHDDVYATVGIHPCHVAQAADDDFHEIEALTAHDRVVGVGETGIDLYWDKTTLPAQQRAFRWHIDLGKRAGLPVIVHDRDAHTEVMDLLAEAGASDATVVLHCFTGDEAMARMAMASGYYAGFGGIVTFKNNTVLPVAAGIPMDRLLIETDAPYLAPVPHRGRRNEPAYAVRTAEAIAQARDMPLASLAQATSNNAGRVFERMR